MVSIIGLFILVAVVVILAIIAYKLIYTYKLNKMIQDGEIKGRKLVDLSKMVMGAIIAGLVLYSGLLMYIIWDAAKQDHSVSRNNYAVIDVSDSDNYNYAGYSGSTELEDAYTEDKGDFPSAEDYAASVGTVSIGME